MPQYGKIWRPASRKTPDPAHTVASEHVEKDAALIDPTPQSISTAVEDSEDIDPLDLMSDLEQSK